MNRRLNRFWVAAAMVAVLCMVSPLASAALVSTGQAIDQGVAARDRARVRAFLERDDARAQLRTLGVDELAAQDRVAGLTDAEVHTLVQKLDTLPAGGNLSNNQVIAIVLVVLLVLLLI